jgi:hypothetical protein
MIDKSVYLAGLRQAYVVLTTETPEYTGIYHATLNKEIIKLFTDDTVGHIDNATDGKLGFYDLKNETAIEIDIDTITGYLFIGFPFEVPPHYLINSDFEGRVTQEDVIRIQQDVYNDLKELKKIQVNRDPANNIISHDLMYRYNILRSYYLQISESSGKDQIFNDKELRDFKKNFIFAEPLDRQILENVVNSCSHVINLNIKNRITFYSEFVNSILAKETGVTVDNLTSTDLVLMEKCIKCWKGIINKHAQEAIANLEQEKAVFMENNPESSVELDEINFVIEILKNITNDIDFSKFKTPMDLFTFWPPVLYPAPAFVLEPYENVLKLV